MTSTAADVDVDFLVIGSGGGGLMAALTAARAGISTIVVEKEEKLGGSTAMSGGILWLPGNPLLGSADSPAEGAKYLDALIGDADASSTPARRSAFLSAVRPLVDFLIAEGMRFHTCDGYSDYYDEYPGGSVRGRALGADIISARDLTGAAAQVLTLPGWNLPVRTHEFAALSLANRTMAGKIMALKVAVRSLRQRLAGAPLFARGAALQARMLLAVSRRSIELRANTRVRSLINENGRITGAKVAGPLGEYHIRARKGVLIAAGGFARNEDLRHKYQSEPTGAKWTLANPGDTGDLLMEAQRHGAVLHHMKEAWWQPVSLKASGAIGGFHSPQELQKPYCIAVNRKGERFVNEAASYMEVGQAMYANDAAPAWIVMEARHRKFYPWGAVPPRITPASWLKSGYMKRADTIAELAAQCGIDPAGLQSTVEKFNTFARSGIDEQFARGAREYDKVYADPRVGPNPALGPLEQKPFYAVEIVPGDVGTAGGIAVDEHSRALHADGTPIPGLYVTGNASAPLFGKWYPGPGASIAASFIFGFIAALHAAGNTTEQTNHV